jgi:diguanylate cyclase (GGDEF)-like protein/PAS domain S-box-containing protein
MGTSTPTTAWRIGCVSGSLTLTVLPGVAAQVEYGLPPHTPLDGLLLGALLLAVLGLIWLLLDRHRCLVHLSRLRDALLQRQATGTPLPLPLPPTEPLTTVVLTLNALLAVERIDSAPLSTPAQLAHFHEAIILVDPHSLRLIEANDAALQLLGYSREGLLTRHLTDLETVDGTARGAELDALAFAGERQYQRLDGALQAVEVHTSLIEHAGTLALCLMFRDATERQRATQHLNYLAYHDSLTGLPNRFLFADRAQQAIGRAHREQTRLAIMMLDLDHFKAINDTLGHDIGDLLLKTVADRLAGELRNIDTVARMGGDEFCLAIPDLELPHAVEVTAHRIFEAIRTPCLLAGHDLRITPSLGISIYPDDGTSLELLVKHADQALYHAKEHGRNRWAYFAATLNQHAAHRQILERTLRTALEHNELCVFYQPQICLGSGQIVGMEALVRWHHPEWGLITPDEFIPIAEQSGLISYLDQWVLRTACAQNQAWQRAGLPRLRVAINMSAHHFLHPSMVDAISQVLDDTGFSPELLELEIPENVAMRNLEHTLEVLQEVRRLGITIALDHFGAGFSSLNSLKRIPIQTLKIDRSFIREMLRSSDDAALVSAIIAMTHNLKRRVVAEAVETEEQLAFLRAHQCDDVQGYLVGKPLPADRFEELLINSMRMTQLV